MQADVPGPVNISLLIINKQGLVSGDFKPAEGNFVAIQGEIILIGPVAMGIPPGEQATPRGCAHRAIDVVIAQ